MKTIITTILSLVLLFAVRAGAQGVEESLNNARSSYAAGDLENARFALQEALRGVNQAIGQDILDMLPTTLGGMDYLPSSDDVTGMNIGFAGLFVNRDYVKDTTLDASFEIVSDSPLLAGINSLLTMSTLFTSDPNQKRIKVDNYKALLTRSEDSEGVVSYEAQVPFGSSLLTFKSTGIEDESEFTGLLNSLPIAKIIDLAE